MTGKIVVYVLTNAVDVEDCLAALAQSNLFSLVEIDDVELIAQQKMEQPACMVVCCHTVEEVAHLTKHLPGLPPAICYSTLNTAANCSAAFRLGFFDYVVQSDNLDLLMQAALRVAHSKNSRRPSQQITAILDMLTPREREVLDYLIRGSLNKITAAELGISEKTVKVHRARIFEKLRVDNVVGLLHLCYEYGIASRNGTTFSSHANKSSTNRVTSPT